MLKRLAFALGVALASAPVSLTGQGLTPLLGGRAQYRAVGEWRDLEVLRVGSAEGVLLGLGPGADTSSVSAFVLAVPLEDEAAFTALGDSLRRHGPPEGRVVVDTTMGDGTRGRLWVLEREPRVLWYDRLARRGEVAILFRAIWPASPPPGGDELPRRLQALGDLLSTIHADGTLVFPAGSLLEVRVY